MALEKVLSQLEKNKPVEKKESTLKKNSDFLDADCLEALQFRINEEEKSSRIYENMSLWFDNQGFAGAAQQWKQDSLDELVHAGWAKEYLLNLGIQPELREIPKQPTSFKSFMDIVEQTYAHEILVTEQCKDLASCAMKCGDHMLYQLALKYLTEQQEELGKTQNLIDKLKAFGTDPVALRLFDNELKG